MRRLHPTACALAVLLLPGAAHAADALLAGKQLRLTAGSLAADGKDSSLTVGAKGGGDDPVVHGGRLHVTSADGDVFDTTFDLPARHWHYLRSGSKVVGYVFHGAPVRSVVVRAGKGVAIRVAGKHLGPSLGANPDPVQVALALGGQQYCMRFGGAAQFKAGKLYAGRKFTAPELCPLDYGDDSRWLCRPGMANNQCFVNDLTATVVAPDGTHDTTEPHVASDQDHSYDCFYVYPTVDLGGKPGLHTDFSDVSLMLDPLLSQAARFNTMCRIFAPLYRQVTFGTFNAPNAAHLQALAYADVRAAFQRYMKYENGGRPIVIMGHSQGTFMVVSLMKEFFDPSPTMRARLVSALLVGGNVGVPQAGIVGGTFQNIPLCTAANQPGCVIAYHTFAEGHPPIGSANAIGSDPAIDTACTNPAALGGGEGRFSRTYFPTHTNQPLFQVGMNPGIPTPFVKFADFYTGECVKDLNNHSYLEIRVRPTMGDVRSNPIDFNHPALSPVLLGTHIVDYNWPQGELLDLVAGQAAAMGLH